MPSWSIRKGTAKHVDSQVSSRQEKVSCSFRSPQHPRAAQSSSSAWATSTSGSTVVDNSSGFAGSEAPGSPADVAARHAAFAAAAGGAFSSTSGSSSGNGGGGGSVQQHQQKQEERRLWSRLGKFKLQAARTTSDTPSEVERKRKAHRVTARNSNNNNDNNHSDMKYLRQPRQGRMVDHRFEILDTLGTGYSGKVKRAVDYNTGEFVAMKVMEKPHPDDPNGAKKFSRLQSEVDAMKKCGQHEHVVSLCEAKYNTIYPRKSGMTAEVHILVLELCEKGELFDVLYGRGPVNPIVCKEYFRQLMSGVKFCHDQGVCHRDLKPENLLLDSDFSLKIADFGFAASGRDTMMCHSIVGSNTYMAPEVIQRRFNFAHDDDPGYDGRKADVWSAGVILFTMLAGHPPMEKATSGDWWFRALHFERQDLFWASHEKTAPRFHDDAKDLISAMLTVDPTKRIGVDRIMRHPYLTAGRSGHSFWRGRHLSPREVVRQEMQGRYDRSMASKRVCTVAGDEPASSSSRGTAVSAGTSGSPTGGSRAAPRASEPEYVEHPCDRNTVRSPGDDRFEVPSMTEEEACKVTGGFMAVGSMRNLVKALVKALDEMGAKINDVNKEASNGAQTHSLRATSKVSAVIPADTKFGGGDVGLVAKVFRVVAAAPPDGDSPSKQEEDGDQQGSESAHKLVVVLRRKRGDYYRYHKVQDALVCRLTSMEGWDSDKKDDSGSSMMPPGSVNMSPRP